MTNSPLTPEPREMQGIDLLNDVADESGPQNGRGRPARWLFVVAALVVIALAVIAIVSLNRGSAASKAAETVASDVRKASDHQEITKQVEGGGQIHLVYSNSEDAYAIQLEGVNAPPSGSEFQVGVYTRTTGQKYEIVDLIGDKPGDAWFGYRGLKQVMTLAVTVVAEGGETTPENDDRVTIESPAE